MSSSNLLLIKVRYSIVGKAQGSDMVMGSSLGSKSVRELQFRDSLIDKLKEIFSNLHLSFFRQ